MIDWLMSQVFLSEKTILGNDDDEGEKKRDSWYVGIPSQRMSSHQKRDKFCSQIIAYFLPNTQFYYTVYNEAFN